VNRKLISARELLTSGYVQEANRLFFHPLGLALAVRQEGDHYSFEGVWDARDDPEGFVFGEGVDEAKAYAVGRQWDRRARVRQAALGFLTQPVGPYDPHPIPPRPPDPPASVLRRRPGSWRSARA